MYLDFVGTTTSSCTQWTAFIDATAIIRDATANVHDAPDRKLIRQKDADADSLTAP